MMSGLVCPSFTNGVPVIVSRAIVPRQKRFACDQLQRCRAGLMNKYQYEAKSKMLETLYGVHVRDFGHRRLERGCSGRDVLALQHFLLEEGYLWETNKDDGAHGYFGDSTKRALQLWQSDVGLPQTGVFDDTSREGYLNYLEEALRMVGMVEGSTGSKIRVSHRTHSALSDGDRWSKIPVDAQMVAVAMAGVLGMTWLYRSAKASMLSNHKTTSTSYSASVNMTSVSVPERKKARANGNHKRRVTERPKKKLSKEELERYIAPMKNIANARSIKMNVSRKEERIDDAVDESKYGRYFGGRQVINDIRKEMDNGSIMTEAPVTSFTTTSSDTMKMVGYDIHDSHGSVGAEGGDDGIFRGTELDAHFDEDARTSSTDKISSLHKDAQSKTTDSHALQGTLVVDADTVILQDKPVKLHKPLRLSPDSCD